MRLNIFINWQWDTKRTGYVEIKQYTIVISILCNFNVIKRGYRIIENKEVPRGTNENQLFETSKLEWQKILKVTQWNNNSQETILKLKYYL